MISWTRTGLPKKDCDVIVWVEDCTGEPYYNTGRYVKFQSKFVDTYYESYPLYEDDEKLIAWAEIQEPEEWRLPK